MAAVRAPLSATNSLASVFSPFSERFSSPRPSSATATTSMMSAANDSLKAPASDANNLKSPSTPGVAPSPITSDVGTEFADTEEAVEDSEIDPAPARGNPEDQDQDQDQGTDEAGQYQFPIDRIRSPNLMVNTSPALPYLAAKGEEAEPQSVIHIPSGFGHFPHRSQDEESETESESQDSTITGQSNRPDLERTRADSNDSVRSDSTITMNQNNPTGRNDLPMPPTPLQTTLPITQDWSSTPRAQTRSDLGALSRPPSSLASILEGDDIQSDYPTDDPSNDESSVSRRAGAFFQTPEDEIAALRSALSECWTLCNTLASLSYIHRERIFAFPNSSTTGSNNSMHQNQQQAWKSCWKLCQNLYDSVYPSTSPGSHQYTAPSRPTLDLCREFCACLFDARGRDNETADSVLRVSFELNNHLFNTHDRSLPEAFRERTLDFYITLCHRLMKQKARMQEETDSLLRACWSLAEMLFSLRQNAREGRRPDEELLGSAVQSCWELCDLFREGWTQIRPERGTPRPSQTTFTQAYQQAKRAGFGMGLDENGNPVANAALLGLPETPTTIFEDTGTVNVISPDDPPPQPNILVLGNHGASDMALRSTNSTPAPGQTHQIVAQVIGTPTGVNAINAGVTPMPMSAHPATQRRFWSSASSISAISEGEERGGPMQGKNPAPTITITNTPRSAATNTTQATATQAQNAAPNQRVVRSTASAKLGAAAPSRGPSKQQHHHQHVEDPTLTLLKILFCKAALHTKRGFSTTSSDPALSSLPLFTRSLPDTAFGTQVWQVSLLENYRKAVANDASFRELGVAGKVAARGGKGAAADGSAGGNNNGGLRHSAVDMARAVKAMTDGVYGFGWLRDLYRLVWGFYVEEALKGDSPAGGPDGQEQGQEEREMSQA